MKDTRNQKTLHTGSHILCKNKILMMERINRMYIFLMFQLNTQYIETSDFETRSMTKLSTEILSSEVIQTISSPHIIHCIDKCTSSNIESGCNTIRYQTVTNKCELVLRDVAQEDICPVPAEKRKREVEENIMSDELQTSLVFSLSVLNPTGKYRNSTNCYVYDMFPS